MKACIAGCQYLPPASYFAQWRHCESLTLEQYENYQKRTWRNRTAILGRGEPLYLTVPLRKGKHEQLPIREVRISYDTDWPSLHLRSIAAAYGKTAFFEEVMAALEPLLHKRFDTLWELNLSTLEAITALLPEKWLFDFSEQWTGIYPEGYTDLRYGVSPGISGAPSDYPSYPQIHQGESHHVYNLSIIDALCHLGPASSNYLSRWPIR